MGVQKARKAMKGEQVQEGSKWYPKKSGGIDASQWTFGGSLALGLDGVGASRA